MLALFRVLEQSCSGIASGAQGKAILALPPGVNIKLSKLLRMVSTTTVVNEAR